MSDDKPVFVQLVELLGVAEAVVNDEPVIVITIRPDPPNFWPHNIALTKDQAWRLATDLGSILLPFVLLVCVLLATATGCGARVDLESADWDSSSGQAARTAVEVDLLQPQPPEQIAEPKDTERPFTPVAAEAKPLNISGNMIILSIRGGDTYYRSETHVYLDAPPVPKVEEPIVIQREVRVEPPRRVNEQCERLAREHEQRVRRWKESPGGS
jgi:hypothetical protein